MAEVRWVNCSSCSRSVVFHCPVFNTADVLLQLIVAVHSG